MKAEKLEKFDIPNQQAAEKLFPRLNLKIFMLLKLKKESQTLSLPPFYYFHLTTRSFMRKLGFSTNVRLCKLLNVFIGGY